MNPAGDNRHSILRTPYKDSLQSVADHIQQHWLTPPKKDATTSLGELSNSWRLCVIVTSMLARPVQNMVAISLPYRLRRTCMNWGRGVTLRPWSHIPTCDGVVQATAAWGWSCCAMVHWSSEHAKEEEREGLFGRAMMVVTTDLGMRNFFPTTFFEKSCHACGEKHPSLCIRSFASSSSHDVQSFLQQVCVLWRTVLCVVWVVSELVAAMAERTLLAKRTQAFTPSPVQQLSLLAQRCNAINLAEGRCTHPILKRTSFLAILLSSFVLRAFGCNYDKLVSSSHFCSLEGFNAQREVFAQLGDKLLCRKWGVGATL